MLVEEKPSAIRLLLDWLYHGDYTSLRMQNFPPHGISTHIEAIDFHLEMYTLADRLNQPDLKDTARNKFSLALNFWKDINSLRAIAYHSDFIPRVFDSALPSYRPLRASICLWLKPHVPKLAADDAFVELMESANGLAIDLIMQLATEG